MISSVKNYRLLCFTFLSYCTRLKTCSKRLRLIFWHINNTSFIYFLVYYRCLLPRIPKDSRSTRIRPAVRHLLCPAADAAAAVAAPSSPAAQSAAVIERGACSYVRTITLGATPAPAAFHLPVANHQLLFVHPTQG